MGLTSVFTDMFTKEPDSISVPLQDARNLWATVSTLTRQRIEYIDGQLERLTPTERSQYFKDRSTLQDLNFEIRRKLDNPKAELDVEKIVKILEVVGKIVGVAL